MLIDAHCHFFTKNVLTQSLSKLENHIARLERMSKPAAKVSSAELVQLGTNTFEFVNKAIQLTPLEMYEDMKESYGEPFIAVPLMLDLSYTFIAPQDKMIENKKSLIRTMKNIAEKKRNEGVSDWMSNLSLSIERKLDVYDRSVMLMDVFKNSYEEQINDLMTAKKQYPDYIFPFFSIDPRRDDEFEEGILGEIKKYIGRDKPFIGLKLYTSLGYSPTHPILYDNAIKESVYEYCEKHQIPITIHASLEGFSHMLDKNYVDGDIYYGSAGRAVPSEDVYEQGIVTYKKNLGQLDFAELTAERLLILNHPFIWKKVLKKYPKLKINMAHFGGSIQISKFLNNNQTGFYSEYIIDLMSEFPNVYTDLSCLYNYENKEDYMIEVYKKLYKPLPEHIKNRVLYGSDYFMISLFNTDLKDYIQSFREAFGEEFIRISETNPTKFIFDS